ncbi:MAG: CHAT domain-containing protein [Chitinophagaceae bacterium]|nr:CHAT domain-containing protein [Chitinophagaceae bacterium]
MRRVFIIILFVICYVLSRSGEPVPVALIQQKYLNADSLFNLSEPTDETDAVARKEFDAIIATCKKQVGFPDSLLFNACWKRGVLAEVLGNYEEAKKLYLDALTIAGQNNRIRDSLQFKPLLYAGGIYYRENKFDSTRILLEKAQELSEKYNMPHEVERLYNTLGALYFEGGNYLQSKNCFEKALQLIARDKNSQPLKIGFENNIATILNRLGRYEEALEKYKKLLQYKRFTDDISLNIGNIYMMMDRYKEALHYFHSSNRIRPSAELLNYMANAHLLLKQYDSAAYYLHLFNVKTNGHAIGVNKITQGIHERYSGDYYAAMGDPVKALQHYQQSVVSMMYDYADTSIYSNPADFSGATSSFNLFNALIKKGDCFEKLYRRDKAVRYLEASLDAYQSAIQLAAYLERTVDTDEARIFLKSNNNIAYNKSIDLAAELYDITGNKELLWKGYYTVERNKSSVLVANLKEFSVKSKMQVPDSLLQREREIKYNIARLQIRLDKQQNETEGDLLTEKRNFELELALLQQKIRQYTWLNKRHDEADARFHAKVLQNSIGKNQALLDFYFSGTALYIFAVTKSDIQYERVSLDEIDFRSIESLQKGLQQTEKLSGSLADSVVKNLFARCIAPFFLLIKDKKEWIILPDGVFYYFPFEILVNPANGRMLIEDYAISYNITTQFITEHEVKVHYKKPSLIALVPFMNKGMHSYADSIILDRLPATRMEVEGLKGKILLDQSATKASFLKSSNHYDILHLATHAVMDVRKPSQSFIAFYPEDSTRPDSYKLYLNELYGLNLDSTRLMLLSACETGVGQFVEGEGVMSLSRGVLYAGCPSVVTTLWPANDKSTAYIINRFYRYMDKGYDLTNALRLSKLDFIKQHPKQMHPSYWAHLVLIGQTQPLYESPFTSKWAFLLGGIAVLLGCMVLIVLIRSKKKGKEETYAIN